MKIGTIGAGAVARSLGTALAVKGHTVRIGSRNPNSDSLRRGLSDQHGDILAAPITEAVEFGDVIILAVNPWSEIEGTLTALGARLTGKPLIDVSNDIEFGAKPRLASPDRSMGERVQQWAPGAQVVKTLNIATAAIMADPASKGLEPAMMWISGDHAGAKAKVTDLLRQIGWREILDLGGIEKSRFQEATGLLVSIALADFPAANR